MGKLEKSEYPDCPRMLHAKMLDLDFEFRAPPDPGFSRYHDLANCQNFYTLFCLDGVQ